MLLVSSKKPILKGNKNIEEKQAAMVELKRDVKIEALAQDQKIKIE